MSSPQLATVTGAPYPASVTVDRVQRCFALRTETAARDASVPAEAQIDNGDEVRYADKCATYSKGIRQAEIGRVDLAAYATLRRALETGNPSDFKTIILGGPRTLNGPQGGLAVNLDSLDGSQFFVPPAPALASDHYATELVELYWASLLRDVAFTDFRTNGVAVRAASELSSMPAYAGPRNTLKQVTTDLLFRGCFPGETLGPYLSQFLLQNTAMGSLPIVQQYITNEPGIDYMLDPLTFQQVQNGIPTGLTLQPLTAPLFLRDGRGLAAYTHAGVLYEAFFTAYLGLNTINGANHAPFNPGNPYLADKTQNGFTTFGLPDIAAVLAAVASEALKVVWFQKWFVHLRHRPESGGAIVFLNNTPSAGSVLGRLSPIVLNSKAVQASSVAHNSCFLAQAFPEGSPTHPAYPAGQGAVAGACITVLKFFFDGAFTFPKPLVPSNDGTSVLPYTGADAGLLTVNGELNKLAHNIGFGHGLHAGIHWRSDTDTAIQLGEAVALSYLQDRAHSYNEKFTIQLQKIDGSIATISNP